MMIDKSAVIGGMRLHYLDREGQAGPVVFLHGLSANAHCFDHITEMVLTPRFRALALDLRGRGSSDKPPTGYSIEEHAEDIIGWLDALGLASVVLVGHSYGGFLASYVAANYSERVAKLVLLDIADSAVRSARTAELLRPSLARLTLSWASKADYIEAMRSAPFLTSAWSVPLESYYDSDVALGEDGLLHSCTRVECVQQAAREAARLDWPDIFRRITQPTLLVYAIDAFGAEGALPVILQEEALTTAGLIHDCRVVPVCGNHITMLFGQGAEAVARALVEFISLTP